MDGGTPSYLRTNWTLSQLDKSNEPMDRCRMTGRKEGNIMRSGEQDQGMDGLHIMDTHMDLHTTFHYFINTQIRCMFNQSS